MYYSHTGTSRAGNGLQRDIYNQGYMPLSSIILIKTIKQYFIGHGPGNGDPFPKEGDRISILTTWMDFGASLVKEYVGLAK